MSVFAFENILFCKPMELNDMYNSACELGQ